METFPGDTKVTYYVSDIGALYPPSLPEIPFSLIAPWFCVNPSQKLVFLINSMTVRCILETNSSLNSVRTQTFTMGNIYFAKCRIIVITLLTNEVNIVSTRQILDTLNNSSDLCSSMIFTKQANF